MISTEILVKEFANVFTSLTKAVQKTALSVQQPENSDSTALVFISKPQHLEQVRKNPPAILILKRPLQNPLPDSSSTAVFECKDLSQAMHAILPYFDWKKDLQTTSQKVMVDIHPSAEIGKNVEIGSFSVIGPNVKIGEGCRIGSNVTVLAESSIGKNTILHPHVYVGARSIIGDCCEIFPFVSIAADGFGYFKDADNKYQKIPQIGKVVLENHVRIGANTTVDRATFFETRIGEGTKIDDHCHIGHNSKIGKNCVLAGGTMLSGSTVLGDRIICGGATLIGDHAEIVDDVLLVSRAVVTNSITEKGAYANYPLEPMKDAHRTLANTRHLTQMRRDIKAMQKKLGLDSET